MFFVPQVAVDDGRARQLGELASEDVDNGLADSAFEQATDRRGPGRSARQLALTPAVVGLNEAVEDGWVDGLQLLK